MSKQSRPFGVALGTLLLSALCACGAANDLEAVEAARAFRALRSSPPTGGPSPTSDASGTWSVDLEYAAPCPEGGQVQVHGGDANRLIGRVEVNVDWFYAKCGVLDLVLDGPASLEGFSDLSVAQPTFETHTAGRVQIEGAVSGDCDFEYAQATDQSMRGTFCGHDLAELLALGGSASPTAVACQAFVDAAVACEGDDSFYKSYACTSYDASACDCSAMYEEMLADMRCEAGLFVPGEAISGACSC